MPTDPDAPDPGEKVLWGPPPPPKPMVTTVSPWAILMLVAGIVCSLVVAWVSYQYFLALAAGMPPSLGLGYTFGLAPFLLASVPLLLIGSLRVVRPWSNRRPWLPWLIVFGVVVWLLVVLAGPDLLVS